MDKKKTHSTQRKYFGTIPRSEFYGIALGYALGLFLTAALRLETQYQELLLAAIGFGIGYYIDKKYFQEPDEPEETLPDEPEDDLSDEPVETVPDEPEVTVPDEPGDALSDEL